MHAQKTAPQRFTGRKSRIGLSAHLLSLSDDYRGAGINRYTYGLLTHLPQAAPHLVPVAFVAEPRLVDERPAGVDVVLSRWPTARSRAARIAWEQLVQPFDLLGQGVSLAHGMAYALPLASSVPGVVTVHDLSVLRYPEAFNRVNRLYIATITRLSVRRARVVIADSESTRQDIIRLLGVAPARVVAVPLGVDEHYRPVAAAEVDQFRARQGLPEQFFLYLGTLEPRKNLPTLVRAYAEMRRRDPRTPPLVLAGGAGWGYAPLFSLVEELGLRDRVVFPGFVPQADLPLWYAAATVFVYPSLYEGFGLPPLEAMACGTPVVTSTASSLPEVVGDAGLTVAPGDVTGLADALQRTLCDQALREELRQRGLARAAGFSWLRTAHATAQVYESVLHGRDVAHTIARVKGGRL